MTNLNLLIDDLPVDVTINGKSFRHAFATKSILRILNKIEKNENVAELLTMFYENLNRRGKITEDDVQKLIEYMNYFLYPTVFQNIEDNEEQQPKTLSYEHDEFAIYGSFARFYPAVDIPTCHWWKFRALFDNLPDDALINRIMGYRAYKAGQNENHEQFMIKMRYRYLLPTED
jgi:hypothetical protein